MQRTLRIAIDAMGGDFAPKNEIDGAILAAKHFGGKTKVEFVFFGPEELLKRELASRDTGGMTYSVVHCDEVISMDDDPTSALRTKKQSSIVQGINYHREGKADAFISAGNTGAVMSGGTLFLGRIRGVSRPTIASFFPTARTMPCLVVDVGANVECKPKFLYEFGIMGSIYVNQILGIESPRVGLLNVGEEETKGSGLALDTHALMKNSKVMNFAGNTEGRDILMGTCDVVVCDGFTGNIVLKFAESFINVLRIKLKDFAGRSLLNKLSVAIMIPTLRRVLKEFDYQEYGGVPLLGVNGVVIIGHGKSSVLAVKNMLLRAVEVIEKDINQRIENALATINETQGEG